MEVAVVLSGWWSFWNASRAQAAWWDSLGGDRPSHIIAILAAALPSSLSGASHSCVGGSGGVTMLLLPDDPAKPDIFSCFYLCHILPRGPLASLAYGSLTIRVLTTNHKPWGGIREVVRKNS